MGSSSSSPQAARGEHRLPARVFINYARQDSEIADWVSNALIRSGAEVFLDRNDIDGGDLWKAELDKALWERQFLVAVVTRNSVAKEREWVYYEQRRAKELLKVIIPCLFEDKAEFYKDDLLPKQLQPFNVVDFHPDREDGLGKLVNTIRGRLRRYGEQCVNQSAGIDHAFVGRDDELCAINDLIDAQPADPTGRKVIGIVGMGGLGKTMLAEELVRRLAFHYSGGVLIESRAGRAQRASVVLQRWAEWALKKPPERIYEAVDVRALLSTFGEMLVLLDDIGEEDLVETQELLKALPADATRLITTRREDVCYGLGAISYPLKPLDGDDSMTLLHDRLRSRFEAGFPGGPQAFEDELRTYQAPLQELATAVGGHPLALSLGVGTCDYLGEIPESVALLTKSLQSGVAAFDLGSAMGVTDRNASLAFSLTHSLADLLKYDRDNGTDWFRRYRALGIFPGTASMSRDLIQAVWGDAEGKAPEATDALKGLCRRAMLNVDHQGLYRSHPVMCAYASGLLEQDPEEHERIWDRYLRCIIGKAAATYRQPQEEWSKHWLLVPHVQEVGRRFIERVEQKAGRLSRVSRPESLAPAAKDALLQIGEETLSLGLRLVESLHEYIIRRPEWGEEGIQCLRLGLVCARALGRSASEVESLKRLGGALSKGNPKLADRYFASALAAARALGDDGQIGQILSYYGELKRTQGDWKGALELLEQGLALHRQAGEAIMEATTLKYSGEIFWRMSRFDEALERYAQAQQIYQDEGVVAGEADILNKIGSVEFNRGNHQLAIERFKEALALHEKLGNRSMQAEDKNDMGAAYRYLGKKEIAQGLFQEARDIDLALGNRRHESIARCNLSATLIDRAMYDEALREAQFAKQIADEVGDPIPLFWSLCWEGTALQNLDRIDEAEARFREALERCRKVGNPRGLAGVLGMLGTLLAEDLPTRAEAVDLFKEAVQVMETNKLDQAFGGRRLDEMRAVLSQVGG